MDFPPDCPLPPLMKRKKYTRQTCKTSKNLMGGAVSQASAFPCVSKTSKGTLHFLYLSHIISESISPTFQKAGRKEPIFRSRPAKRNLLEDTPLSEVNKPQRARDRAPFSRTCPFPPVLMIHCPFCELIPRIDAEPWNASHHFHKGARG